MACQRKPDARRGQRPRHHRDRDREGTASSPVTCHGVTSGQIQSSGRKLLSRELTEQGYVLAGRTRVGEEPLVTREKRERDTRFRGQN